MADSVDDDSAEDEFVDCIIEAAAEINTRLADEISSILTATCRSALSKVYLEHKRVCQQLQYENEALHDMALLAQKQLETQERQVTGESQRSRNSGWSKQSRSTKKEISDRSQKLEGIEELELPIHQRQLSKKQTTRKGIEEVELPIHQRQLAKKHTTRNLIKSSSSERLADLWNQDPAPQKDTLTENATDDNSPVEDGSEDSEKSGKTLRFRFKRFVESPIATTFFAATIIASIVLVGIEAQVDTAGAITDEVQLCFWSLDATIALIFVVEFTFRLFASGSEFLLPPSKNLGNCCDGVFVLLCIGLDWIIPLLIISYHWDSQVGILQGVQISLRIGRLLARLMRLIRIISKMNMFSDVRKLLLGLVGSVNMLFWTVIVICFIAYVFAILGCVIITRPLQQQYDNFIASESESEDVAVLADVLPQIDRLTNLLNYLVLFTCGKEDPAILVKILKFQPMTCFFFYAYTAISTIVLMNLVTAIIVETAFHNSKREEESELQDRLREMFFFIDTDGNGELSWDEFKESFEDPQLAKQWKDLNICIDECEEIFRLLDETGQGAIDSSEFFEGITRFKGPALSKDVLRMFQAIERLESKVGSNNGMKMSLLKSMASRRNMLNAKSGVESAMGKDIEKSDAIDSSGITAENVSKENGSSSEKDSLGIQAPSESIPGAQHPSTELPTESSRHPSKEMPIESSKHPSTELSAESSRHPSKELPTESSKHPSKELPIESSQHPSTELPIQFAKHPRKELPNESSKHPNTANMAKAKEEFCLQINWASSAELTGRGGNRKSQSDEVAWTMPVERCNATFDRASPTVGGGCEATNAKSPAELSRMQCL